MTDRVSSLLVTPSQRALRRLLSAAFDDPSRANETVLTALAQAELAELPDDAGTILDFARTFVAPIVSAAIGARLAQAFVADYEEELSALPTPPMPFPTPLSPPLIIPLDRSSTPRMAALSCSVLLVDADRLARAPLARALVRGGCDVTAVEDVAGTAAALRAEKIDVALLDADHAQFEGLIRAIAEAPGSVAIVARADSVATANSKLLASGARDFAVRPKTVPTAELLALIGRFIGPT